MKLSPSVAVAALLVLFAPLASAQVKIGVVSSATGAMAAVGKPHRNAISLLPRRIGDLTVEYISYDDESDPALTLTLIKKLIEGHKVDAIIGPTGSPAALAAIPVVAAAGVPLLAPVGSVAVVKPMDEQKRWVFKTTPNDDIMAAVLVAHMKKTGIASVGIIAFNDGYGERWISTFSALAQRADLRVAAVERFGAGAAPTAETKRLLAQNPDAVLIAGTGPSALAPHLVLVGQGYKGAIYHTHGATSAEFVRLGDKKVVGALMAASPMLAINDMPDGNPSKALARGYVAAYEKLHGDRAVTFGANVYDAGLLLAQAIPKAIMQGKPGTAAFRTALRDALERTREFPVTQGVVNMTPEDHSGFDGRGRVMLTIRDHTWRRVGE